MLFAVGTKVKFLHTGDEGVVTGMLEGGMVNVYIRSADMEIPAYLDDLIRAEEFISHPVNAKIVQGKKETAPPKAPPVEIQTQYTILKSQGIQIAFEAVEKSGMVEKYNIYLLNDTVYELLYNIKFLLNYRRPVTWDGKIGGTSIIKLGEMDYDNLNDAPELEVECRWITTEEVGKPEFKSLKIKPKTFFNNLRTAPFLNKPVHLYKLFEKLSSAEQAQKTEDLQSYTRRHSQPAWTFDEKFRKLSIYDTKELAEFEPEIDLHIEKLAENWRKLSAAEILRIQLTAFENYLAKAIRLGVPQVFIIHGVGEGRLRNEIATRLMKNPDVQTFKNEYHPKYGWGATEVVL